MHFARRELRVYSRAGLEAISVRAKLILELFETNQSPFVAVFAANRSRSLKPVRATLISYIFISTVTVHYAVTLCCCPIPTSSICILYIVCRLTVYQAHGMCFDVQEDEDITAAIMAWACGHRFCSSHFPCCLDIPRNLEYRIVQDNRAFWESALEAATVADEGHCESSGEEDALGRCEAELARGAPKSRKRK